MNKCLVLFVEGQTEVEFYKALIKYIRECHVDKKLEHKVIYRSIDGIGGYKKEVNRIFLKEVLPKVEGYQITVALCYDTDVFGYVQKPKINWKEVEKLLKDDGAHRVLHIKAEKSIEDWFLIEKSHRLFSCSNYVAHNLRKKHVLLRSRYLTISKKQCVIVAIAENSFLFVLLW